MSVKASTWAWEQAVPGTQKLVLLALADYVGRENHSAWPAVSTIADRCGLGRRTVERSLTALEEAKLIEIVSRPNKSNLYHLLGLTRQIDAPGTSERRPRQIDAPRQNDAPGTSERRTGYVTVTHEPYKNRKGTVKDIGEKKSKKKKEVVTLPAQLKTPEFVRAWEGFVEMRKSIKKPLTARAASLILDKLDGMGLANAIESLEASTMNSWQGVFPPKAEGPKPAGGANYSAAAKPRSTWEVKTQIDAIKSKIADIRNSCSADAWGPNLTDYDKAQIRELTTKLRGLEKELIG